MKVVPRARIIVADSKDSSRRLTRDILQRSAYQVVAETKNMPDTLRKCRTFYPDLLVIDSSLEGGSVIELAGIVEGDNLAQVLILTGEKDGHLRRDYAHVDKPVSEETLLSVVEVCLFYKQQVENMQKELGKMREEINTRKLVEQAKGILMKTLGIDEKDAYRRIQKESMNRGLNKKEVARAIIIAFDSDVT